MNDACNDVSVLGTFTESHDVPRIASWTSDFSLAKNALTFTLMWDGIPIVYAGQEQHYAGYADPTNREATWLSGYDTEAELYVTTTALNAVRNRVIALDSGYTTYGIAPIYNDTDTVAFRKGADGNQIISVLTNLGEGSENTTLGLTNTGWDEGTLVVEILSCKTGTVGDDGTLDVPMEKGLPRVYVAGQVVQGSVLCPEASAMVATGRKKGDAVGNRAWSMVWLLSAAGVASVIVF